MKRLLPGGMMVHKAIRAILFICVFALWSLVFVDIAPAPEPPPPPPPPVPAVGLVSQAFGVAAIALYGVLRIRKRK